MVVGNPNEQLVCDLVVDNDTEASPFLQSLNHQFIDCFKVRRINVVCYYERVKSKTVQVREFLGRYKEQANNFTERR